MEANNQTVPSLSELLVMAKKHNVSLIFDLKTEKNSTGFRNSDSYYTTETIKESGISPEKVIIAMKCYIYFYYIFRNFLVCTFFFVLNDRMLKHFVFFYQGYFSIVYMQW